MITTITTLSKYNVSRNNILFVILFTVVNLILLFSGSQTYFVFSASVPYYLIFLGLLLCGKLPAEYYDGNFADMAFFSDGFLVVMITIVVVILLLYFLAWLFAKKQRYGWLIFALVIFVIDTVCMFWLNGISIDSILDILFHAWVVYSLISGIVSALKLKKIPEEMIFEACPDNISYADNSGDAAVNIDSTDNAGITENTASDKTDINSGNE